MDWRSLLSNRWALAGLGVAGLVGGVVWYQRRKDGGGGSGGDAPRYSSGAIGAFDTYGTDVSGFLSSWATGQASELRGFLDEIKASPGVGAIPPASSAPPVVTAPAPTPPRKTLPVPVPVKKTAVAPRYVTVARYTSKTPAWNSTLSGIARRSGTTVAALLRLNPSIRNPDVIQTGARLRVG